MFTKNIRHIGGKFSLELELDSRCILRQLRNFSKINTQRLSLLSKKSVKKIQNSKLIENVSNLTEKQKYHRHNGILSNWFNPVNSSITSHMTVQCRACIGQQFRYMCTKPTVSRGRTVKVEEFSIPESQTNPVKSHPLDKKARSGRKKQTALQRVSVVI